MNDGDAAPMKSQYCGYLNKTWTTTTSEDTMGIPENSTPMQRTTCI